MPTKSEEREELEAKEKAAEKAAKESEKAAKESKEANKERLEKLTFDERVDEVRSLGYLVGREDATGLSDGTNARQTSPTEAKLTVVQDDYKYTVALDELDRGLWSLQAQEVGDILGVAFDTEELEAGNPEDANVRAARSAAFTAGGSFVPGKPGENPYPKNRVAPSGVSPITTRGRGF